MHIVTCCSALVLGCDCASTCRPLQSGENKPAAALVPHLRRAPWQAVGAPQRVGRHAKQVLHAAVPLGVHVCVGPSAGKALCACCHPQPERTLPSP